MFDQTQKEENCLYKRVCIILLEKTMVMNRNKVLTRPNIYDCNSMHKFSLSLQPIKC